VSVITEDEQRRVVQGVVEVIEAKILPPYLARIQALESALVHVAFETTHAAGNKILIDGLSLGDIYHVRVKMPDGSVVEADCKTMLKHWRDGTRPERRPDPFR
jgi:hypothetical protein